MCMPLHLQVEWQATPRTLDGTETLVALWLLKLGIRRVSDGDLVLLGGNLDRLDLAKDHVGGGIASEKGGGRILDKQEEHYLLLFICFVLCEILQCWYTAATHLSWWSITNCIVNDLNGTGQRHRKNCVCGNGGGFFRCFLG